MNREQVLCDVCPKFCKLREGQIGFCRARSNIGGRIVPINYGQATSLALDPIEKKPLMRFCSGTYILSYGSYGCNLRCPYCQNASISMAGPDNCPHRLITPEGLTDLAVDLSKQEPRNIGVAFTYNEPTVCFEFIRDTSKLLHEAGLKSVTIQVNGENAYGYLKSEKGIHRLVRVSPFDSAGRRQTSFASCDVMPEIEDDTEIEIKPDDIRIDTYRASGAGGQHINKTSSAIRITHFPTGVVVSCQEERSQFANKDKAFKMLRSKLLALKIEEQMQKLAEIRGDVKEIGWGSQIRSYIFMPYTLVKDHRTGEETGKVDAVMDGEIDNFISAYLAWIHS